MKRQVSKRHRAKMRAKRRRARRRLSRDSRVVARYGSRAHRSCGRKARYATRNEAEYHALLATKHASVDLRSYHCPLCGGYHLTHTEQIERRSGAEVDT